MDWILAHWQEITIGIMVLDKIVAITPTKYDDILLTGIKSIFGAIATKKK